MNISVGLFEWDEVKERQNFEKHKVDFSTASQAFADPRRVLAVDELHSEFEDRYFCLGKVGDQVLTVRFTKRGNRIRILGAGYWRKGKSLYEKENR